MDLNLNRLNSIQRMFFSHRVPTRGEVTWEHVDYCHHGQYRFDTVASSLLIFSACVLLQITSVEQYFGPLSVESIAQVENRPEMYSTFGRRRLINITHCLSLTFLEECFHFGPMQSNAPHVGHHFH